MAISCSEPPDSHRESWRNPSFADQVDYSGCGEREALSYYVRWREKEGSREERGDREGRGRWDPSSFPLRSSSPENFSFRRWTDATSLSSTGAWDYPVRFLPFFTSSSIGSRRADTMKTLNRRPYLLSLQLFRALIFSTTSAPSPPFSQSLSPRSASLHAINTEDRSIGHGATTVQQVFSRYTAFSSLAYPFLSRRVCQVT